MAESIALGLRLGTAAEHANFAGIEGEITINETEKRAVVHDGTTKGGFPMARLDETGYALAKSSDGTKLQLKNKAGTVLSETDAPSSGSGVHVGNEAPTDAATDVWIDLDEPSSGVVTKVNGKSPDSSGNVTITVGSDYTLPTASSSTLGGVKIGSNITNSSGTISVSKTNVTNALGYTPVKTVNGTTANTSGAVTIDVGVKTVNGTSPDSNGNVTINVSGGSSADSLKSTGGTFNGTTVFKEASGSTAAVVGSAYPIESGKVVIFGNSGTLYGSSVGCGLEVTEKGINASVVTDNGKSFVFGVSQTSVGFYSFDGSSINYLMMYSGRAVPTTGKGNVAVSVNGVKADNNGNIELDLAGDSGDYLTKDSITYGTSDLTAGSSALATGSVYLVYE